jgi:hypothetical protein
MDSLTSLGGQEVRALTLDNLGVAVSGARGSYLARSLDEERSAGGEAACGLRARRPASRRRRDSARDLAWLSDAYRQRRPRGGTSYERRVTVGRRSGAIRAPRWSGGGGSPCAEPNGRPVAQSPWCPARNGPCSAMVFSTQWTVTHSAPATWTVAALASTSSRSEAARAARPARGAAVQCRRGEVRISSR